MGEAQTALAEQYGFRTWPDLKAEVDKRREGTRTVDPDVAAAIADSFGLGEVTAPVTAAERRWAGQVWSMTTDSGRFAAMELRVDHRPDTEVALLQASIDAGVAAPPPVVSKAGRVIEEIAGARWRIHRWVPHGPAPAKPVAPAVAAAAGRALGLIHSIRMLATGGVASWLTYRRSPPEWQTLVDKSRTAGAKWTAQLEAAIPAFLDVSEIRDETERSADDELLIIGNPFSPGSTRLAGEGTLLLVDWEHAGPTKRHWELAGMLGWAEDGGGDIDPSLARALVDAYVAEAGPVELDLGSFTTAISANLNWVASRVNVALDAPDPVERELARKELPGLLAKPPSRAHFETLLAAVT